MTWNIVISPEAEKQLKKLDGQWAKKILIYMQERIAPLPDPTVQGKALRSNLAGLHRYRVENYRVICQIKNDVIEIHVISIGHRSDVYKTN